MPFSSKNSLICVLSLVALTACASSGDRLRYSESDQTAALEACAEQLQLPLFAQRLPSNDGPSSIFAVNASGVTLAQARSINQCKHQTLAANYAPVQ
jgi:hypothetical protein